MSGRVRVIFFSIVFSLAALLSACVGELGYESPEDEMNARPKVAYGQSADLLLASDLQLFMRDRDAWPSFIGLEGVQPGTGPHGSLQKFRLNDIASSRPDSMPSGSIVVCESYASMDAPAPSSMAVMQRVDGYDPMHGNWFWVVLDADGALVDDERGVKLAGRLGVGDENGCSGCHAGAAGEDFVFSNGR